MASAASALVQALSLHQARDGQHSPHGKSCPLRTPLLRATRPVRLPSRRQMAFLLAASTALTAARPRTSAAQDIPLFGLRKKLRKAEEEAEEIVREGFEAAEKGIETALTAAQPRTSTAQDIPLFGLRKKLRKAEEEAEEIVREGFEVAEKGIETAEKGIVAAEKGVETAEREIESAVSFGALAQAGVVAAAEVVGVLVATSVVNGILGPEGQRS